MDHHLPWTALMVCYCLLVVLVCCWPSLPLILSHVWALFYICITCVLFLVCIVLCNLNFTALCFIWRPLLFRSFYNFSTLSVLYFAHSSLNFIELTSMPSILSKKHYAFNFFFNFSALNTCIVNYSCWHVVYINFSWHIDYHIICVLVCILYNFKLYPIDLPSMPEILIF